MILSTRAITEEYCEGALVITVLDTDRGGTTFSTVSAVEELGTQMLFLAIASTVTPPSHPTVLDLDNLDIKLPCLNF